MPLNPTDLPLLSRLLDEAQALPAGEREAWLAALPPAHEHLAPHLRPMLVASGTTTGSDGLSTLPRLDDDGAVATAGERVGPYRVLREIGRGGMGSVWLAERAEGTFQRRVALKLPRVAWTEGLAARMAREQRIAALLEHPNIARMYDAGADERGRPFIAMAYIDGDPIDTYCDAKGLDTKARLRLYLQVVRAVAYAHGRLVIHRDLKPANVLVDATGNAHLLDFGIAKLLDDTTQENNLTQEQGRVLTPSYAAPEQIAGQPVSVATDVYSLGVTLYQLLAGQLPYRPRRRTAAAMEDAIMAGDAPLASSQTTDKARSRALRGEVDAILNKALQREPARRYATADALAQDIERYLQGDTVSAKPDSLAYRARKALKRHWVGFGAGAVVLLAVLVGGGTTWWQAREAAREAQRTRIATQFVSEMFRVNAQSGLRGREGNAGSSGVEQAAELIAARFAGQPDVQAELYGAVGRVYADIGASQLAVRYANRQIAALDLARSGPEIRVRALLLLADANVRGGRYVDAEKVLREAVRLSDAASALGFEAQVVLAEVLYNVEGKWSEADGIVADLMKSRWASSDTPTMGGARLLWLRARTGKGRLLNDAAIRMAVDVEGNSSYWANRMRLTLAAKLVSRDRAAAFSLYEEAMQALARAGDVGRIQGASLSAPFWRMVSGNNARPPAEAMRVLQASRSTLQEFGSAIPPETIAEVDLQIGLTVIRLGGASRAYQQITSAAAVLLESRDSFSLRQEYLQSLAIVEAITGRHAQADADFRELIRLSEASGDGNSARAAMNWHLLVHNLVMAGRAIDAERELRTAPAFSEPAALRIIAVARAWVRFSQGDAYAWRLLPEVVEPLRPSSTEAWVRGVVMCESGHARDGLPLVVGWLDAARPTLTEDAPALGRTGSVAALCALQLGDRQRAEVWASQARRIFESQSEVSDWFKEPLRRLEQKLAGAPGHRRQ